MATQRQHDRTLAQVRAGEDDGGHVGRPSPRRWEAARRLSELCWIGARVAALAEPGQILVTRTVTDVVTGSDVAVADHGEHELKGVPGAWHLFAVRS